MYVSSKAHIFRVSPVFCIDICININQKISAWQQHHPTLLHWYYTFILDNSIARLLCIDIPQFFLITASRKPSAFICHNLPPIKTSPDPFASIYHYFLWITASPDLSALISHKFFPITAPPNPSAFIYHDFCLITSSHNPSALI